MNMKFMLLVVNCLHMDTFKIQIVQAHYILHEESSTDPMDSRDFWLPGSSDPLI